MKKREAISVLMVIVISALYFNLFADGVQPSGSGTIEDPYQVATLENLLWISTNSDSWSSHFKQTAPIDASDTANWNDGAGFSPIGNAITKFAGSYNGNHHPIDCLTIIRTVDNIGLFGWTDNADISNVGLYNVNIIGYNDVGGLVGNLDNNSQLLLCSSWEGTLHGNGQCVGGLVGNISFSSIEECFSSTDVSGDDQRIGGLAGHNFNSTINYSDANGHVIGSNYVGGLVGRNYAAVINNCTATGSVSGTSDRVGGVTGYNAFSSTVSNCSATGDVSGATEVGGLVGYCYDESNINCSFATGAVNGTGDKVGGLVGYSYWSCTITNCYAAGSVTGINDVGGLVGRNYRYSNISNSYATGNVSGSSNIGGISGYTGYIASVLNSFWDIETSEQLTSAGGTGKTTTEMKDVATFTNEITVGLDDAWDFVGNPNDDTGNEDFWNIDCTNNNGYPFPSWQVFEVIPPAPTNIYISIFGDDVELTWDDMGVPNYNIYRSTNPYILEWGEAIGISDVNSYIDADAALELMYFYLITSEN